MADNKVYAVGGSVTHMWQPVKSTYRLYFRSVRCGQIK